MDLHVSMCILYKKVFEGSKKCLKYGLSRYKVNYNDKYNTNEMVKDDSFVSFFEIF